jgi:hypothetical protein
LIVSIGPKNPSWTYAPTSPRGISFANVSSTSSSPGAIQSKISRRMTKNPPLIRTPDVSIARTSRTVPSSSAWTMCAWK